MSYNKPNQNQISIERTTNCAILKTSFGFWLHKNKHKHKKGGFHDLYLLCPSCKHLACLAPAGYWHPPGKNQRSCIHVRVCVWEKECTTCTLMDSTCRGESVEVGYLQGEGGWFVAHVAPHYVTLDGQHSALRLHLSRGAAWSRGSGAGGRVVSLLPPHRDPRGQIEEPRAELKDVQHGETGIGEAESPDSTQPDQAFSQDT